MRPRYETNADRKRQQDAVARLAGHMGVEAKPTADLAPWDYDLHRAGELVAIVEVKCRLCLSTTYPTYMIGSAKVETLRDAAAERGVPGLLLVAWMDRLGLIDAGVAASRAMRAHGGRVDRGDPLDLEPVLHIPMALFKLST
jgi:hypothetical protein